jgi:AcrR family transcriptional regulator
MSRLFSLLSAVLSLVRTIDPDALQNQRFRDMSGEPDRSARADAQRNRTRVLRAAQQAFASEGSSVSLERIARLAGLGTGTVYRHFPSKEGLLEAVITQRIDEMVARAAWWASSADPLTAFFGFLADAVESTGEHKDLCDAFRADTSWPRVGFTASGRRFEHAVARLLRAAQQVGAVRDDVTVAEVNTLILGCAVMHRAHRDGGRVVQRVLGTLRADAAGTVTEPGSITEFRDSSGTGRPRTRDRGPLSPPTCAVCGTALRREPVGRPSRYCGAACRQRAHRKRARSARSAVAP